LPSSGPVAQRFLSALSARHFSALHELLSHASARRFSTTDIKRTVSQIITTGGVTKLDARSSAGVRQPKAMANPSPSPAPTATVGYTVTYRSAAARRPVSLSGRLDLSYDIHHDDWKVGWSPSLLLPGIKGATGLRATYKQSRRGRILDRKGRVIATGTGQNRRYPFGPLAGATIGTLAPVTKANATDYPDADIGDLVGTSGLEGGLEKELAGRPSSRLDVVGKHGRLLEKVGGYGGKPGRDVKTTLDMGVERVATDALGSQPGGAVVMDPRTGSLLALVASSSFDPNNYVGVAGVSPFNRALSGLYPPGSSFKVVTGSAALDTGVVTPQTQLPGPKDYRGVHNFHNEHFSSISFAGATEFSVNTVFAQVALRLGNKRFMHYIDAFGFNHKVDLPVSAATSSVPPLQDDYDLMFSAFGQAQVLATPLEMATVAATVADHGKRMDPRILSSQRPSGKRIMKRSTAATMTKLMELVVQGGTGVNAQIPGVSVAGKTGTAEVDTPEGRKNHAWFISFVPSVSPRLAVAVVAEYGGVGGVVAAPIARNIMTGSLPLVR
jgi:peptidoglycan glycosyltransferase